MKKFNFTAVLCLILVVIKPCSSFGTENIPLKKVTLYSSGVAHYEHEGKVKGSEKIDFLFSARQINDVLKSLTVYDPAAKNLNIEYRPENALSEVLESLKLNLSSSQSLYDILKSRRGAEIEVFTPNKITGKLVSAEIKTRQTAGSLNAGSFEYISLLSEGKIQIIPFSGIHSFRFTDEALNRDLDTALSLILENNSNDKKQLSVNLKTAEESAERNVKFSYVMEAPVWKAGYRMNVNGDKADFQSWAIVDNSSSSDWENITLTLTTGKPSAFIQNLYAPHYTYRKELPLLIAGAAAPVTFETGTVYENITENDYTIEYKEKRASEKNVLKKDYPLNFSDGLPETPYFDGQLEENAVKGEMFSFTPAAPINLKKQKSIMIPLSASSIPAEKVSVFSAVYSERKVNPKLCISIENTSGFKLPAGAVTVFEGGVYAGDAVLEFLPAGEKRLIAYGDDLELSASVTNSSERNIESVKIAGGVVSVFYKEIKETEYTVKNSSESKRKIIFEHPVNPSLKLLTEKNLVEKTGGKYRFKFESDAGNKEKLIIKKERIISAKHGILNTSDDFFISMQANTEISQQARKTFQLIISKREELNKARGNLQIFQNEKNRLVSEQQRARENLEAFGKDTSEGKEFIEKILHLEKQLDELSVKICQSEENLQKTEKEFNTFIKDIKIE